VPQAPKNRYFRISENSQKPLFLLGFRHIGPSSFGRFGDQNGDRRADRPADTQKQRKCRPSGAQGPKISENGPPGGGSMKSLFDLFSSIFGFGTPGRPGGCPRDDFTCFLSIFDRFWVIFWRFFIDFPSIIWLISSAADCRVRFTSLAKRAQKKFSGVPSCFRTSSASCFDGRVRAAGTDRSMDRPMDRSMDQMD
jgi:hypothetical protein